jgi:DHA2 family multidrug resistance protein
VLFDINPPENHGKAMALWGQGVLLGPMIGPILGGWLTDNYSWRWVFYINVPLGIMALMGILAYLPKGEPRRSRFDLFGFALLSLAIGAFQIMLDRGSLKDWFSSTEIWIEATLAGLSLYLFLVHSVTSRNPFIHLSMFRDPNFVAGNVFIFVVGIVLFATLALVPPMLQNLMGYPVLDAGLLIAPRSIGSLVAMLVLGRIVNRVDPRVVIGGGFLLTALSVWQMTHFNLAMDGKLLVISAILQGMGTGAAYVSMASLTFATLPPHLRNEGTAMFSLMRNIGSSIGISIVQTLLTSNTQVVHSTLAEHITPYNLVARDPQMAMQLSTHAGIAALDGAITAQAAMVAYLDDFQLMFIVMLLTLPLLLIVRIKKTKGEDAPHVAIE